VRRSRSAKGLSPPAAEGTSPSSGNDSSAIERARRYVTSPLAFGAASCGRQLPPVDESAPWRRRALPNLALWRSRRRLIASSASAVARPPRVEFAGRRSCRG
jgi:hypothetical protein